MRSWPAGSGKRQSLPYRLRTAPKLGQHQNTGLVMIVLGGSLDHHVCRDFVLVASLGHISVFMR